MDLSLAFEPRLPLLLIGGLAALGVALAIAGAAAGAKGAGLRLLLIALVALALANPTLIAEDRAPLNDVAALVIDTSGSQDIGARRADAEAAAARIKERAARLKNLELRAVEAGEGPDGGTDLFAALERAFADVPPDRIAGAILVTDGQVHDVPLDGKPGFAAPLHVLLTGEPGERDRKLTLDQAPRFGIVGDVAEIKLRVEDFGAETSAPATLTVRIDGGPPVTRPVTPGRTETIAVTLSHGGENVVELEVNEGPAELTLLNNRAVAVINGVRDRLRVLLISGEPHAGERAWRNLLKADPSVDLVHFTILRPPEKQDDTPIDELSLIAFPTRELFAEKLDQFDLIIFDRYRRRAILPMIYYYNIAQYVRDGGAILVASGPDYASPLSIYRTALGELLPARPTGGVMEEGFRPLVSADGAKHPVTAGLPGANIGTDAPRWGRWFRLVEADQTSGRELMSGPDGKPLLVLDRVGDGRVALMLSDQAWLWTRGVEGGGPQAELLRRLAHWLMKEPDLEEERLSGRIDQGVLRIERRSMQKELPPVTVTAPSGKETQIALAEAAAGRFAGEMKAEEAGLYRLRQGELVAVAAAGILNAREFIDVRATADVLSPVASSSGGGARWLKDNADPELRLVGAGREANGDRWLGLRANGAYVVTSVSETPLLHPALALALILGSLLLAWRVEGR